MSTLGLGQPSVPADPEHNVFRALQRWVEHDIAPDAILATKYLNDDPTKGVERIRPLCPYPQVAAYKGSGITGEAANFECK